jgi:hypothetical protein
VRTILLTALLATQVHAAVIRGIVTEALTGAPLARTLVQIQPIGGTEGSSRTVRAGERGSFEFGGLAAGAWIVKASRPGYLPLENGQRRWNSAGFPVMVAADDAPFITFRLQRTAAINGTVRDENEIGIRDFDVVAYSNAQPPRIAARGKADDRGVYRISGLEPGTYYVRSAAHIEEELNFIPTFAPATVQIENARPVEVFADEETRNFDLRPQQGKLFRLSGEVVGLDPDPTRYSDVIVTLASEMVREIRHGSTFQFTGLAPGDYELYVEAPENPPRAGIAGGYVRFSLAKDIDKYALSARDTRETQFTFAPDRGRSKPPGQLYARRKDLAGVGPVKAVELPFNAALFAPGGWDLLFLPNPGNYVSGFSGSSYDTPVSRKAVRITERYRPEGWNSVILQGFSSVRYQLNGGGATVTGTVKQNGEPVLGAPVFLEAWDALNRTRLVELIPSRADLHGLYRFEGLPPGTYRIFSSFEYLNPDSAAFDLALAQTIQLDAHGTVTHDLDLYGAR